MLGKVTWVFGGYLGVGVGDLGILGGYLGVGGGNLSVWRSYYGACFHTFML